MNTPLASTSPQPPGHHLTSPDESAGTARLGTILAGYGLVLVLLFGRYAAPLDAWNSKETSALHWLAAQSWTPVSHAAGVVARLSSYSAAPMVLVSAGVVVGAVRGTRQAVVSVLIATTSLVGRLVRGDHRKQARAASRDCRGHFRLRGRVPGRADTPGYNGRCCRGQGTRTRPSTMVRPRGCPPG